MKDEIKYIPFERLLDHMGSETILKYLMLKAKSEIKQEKNVSRFLYVIQSAKGFKIGISNKPIQRLKQLQVGNESDLQLVYQLDVGSKAIDLERFVHLKLKKYSTRGEWFNCSLPTIKKIITKSFNTKK